MGPELSRSAGLSTTIAPGWQNIWKKVHYEDHNVYFLVWLITNIFCPLLFTSDKKLI